MRVIIVSNDTLSEVHMNIKEIMKHTFLFKDVSESYIDSALSSIKSEIVAFTRGDLVYSSESNERKVGFVLEGKCEVWHSKGEGTSSMLNTLIESDCFGIISVLSEKEFPTQIFATKNSTIFFINKQDLFKIVNNNSQTAMNLIAFLANRISFLNEKIATFSGTRVEDRLASYLVSKCKALDSLKFHLNCKKCSEAINSGRASVYRALASLESEGLIEVVDKKIIIMDLKGLERITK